MDPAPPTPPRRDAWIVFAAALALRGALIAETSGDPVFRIPMLDAEYAVDWARAVAAGDFWGSPESTAYFRTPLYAWFLGLAFLLPGGDLSVAVWLQAVLGALTCALLTDIAGRRLGRAAGLAAGALAAVSWPLLLFGRQLLITSIVPFLGAGALWAHSRAARSASAARWLGLGAALGVAALARPNFLVLVPVFLGLALVRPGGRAARSLCLAVGILLLVVPITIRNRVVSGEWIPLSYQAGLNLWVGNHPGADGMSARLPGLSSWHNEDVEALLAREHGRRLGPGEQDTHYRGLFLDFVRSQPGRAAALLVRKTYLFLQGYEIRNNRDLYALRERSAILRLPLPDFSWILPLAVLGGFAHRRRWRDLADWWGYALAMSAGVIVFFVCARYRLAAWPAFLLFAGAGTAALLEWGRGARVLAGRAAIVLAVAAAARADFLGIRNPDPAETHFQYGNVYARAGDLETAERELRTALQLSPGLAEARYHLGALLLQQGRGEALPLLREAAGSLPESFRVRRSLAEALEAAGAFEEALGVRRETAELSAGAFQDRQALADALGRAGRIPEAWKIYEDLLEGADGEDAYLLLNAGQTALALKRPDVGLDLVRRATRDPATAARAYEAIARYHLSIRQTQEALPVLSEGILRVPDVPVLHSLRALARYASGDASGAIEDLERVVELEPEDEAARQILEDIRAGKKPRL